MKGSTDLESRLPSAGAYGDRFASYFKLAKASIFRTGSLRTGEIAYTETSGYCHKPEPSVPVPPEDAFLVQTQLQDYPNHISWEDGRPGIVGTLRAGHTILRDLQRKPNAIIMGPHHTVHFYIPRATFNTVAEDLEARSISELAYVPAQPIDDDVIRGLIGTVRAAIKAPEETNRLFLDHLMMAAAVHLAQTYGGLKPRSLQHRGGLAPWQARLAIELLEGDLTGQLPLKDVAAACKLSVSYFSKAFCKTTGLAPHQWLLYRRVERAKSAMINEKTTLAEVALSCGFSDQSHFTRVFVRLVGTSPATWRRARNL